MDLIYRRDAIEECKLEFLNPNVERETEELTLIDQSFAKGWNQANSIWIKVLEKLPSATKLEAKELQDVKVERDYWKQRAKYAERPKGEWIDLDEYQIMDWMSKNKCSICGKITFGELKNYCPHCGADMRGEG